MPKHLVKDMLLAYRSANGGHKAFTSGLFHFSSNLKLLSRIESVATHELSLGKSPKALLQHGALFLRDIRVPEPPGHH